MLPMLKIRMLWSNIPICIHVVKRIYIHVYIPVKCRGRSAGWNVIFALTSTAPCIHLNSRVALALNLGLAARGRGLAARGRGLGLSLT